MKYYLFGFVFILAPCVPVMQTAVAETLPETPPTQIISPITEPAPTSIPVTPSPTTVVDSCDPFVVDFCITEGHFIFQNPIYSPGNTFVDTTYRYGSTQNDTRDPHHGVEFLNMFGTPVHAAGDGVV